MKILYLSDDYGAQVAGTKQSLFRELKRRGIAVEWGNIHTAGNGSIDGPRLLRQLESGGFTDLWLVHTWWRFDRCSLDDINGLDVYVVSFGLSDPTGWDEDKLNDSHIYVTNDWETYHKVSKPIIFCPPACDVQFHRRVEVKKDIDVLFYGMGRHPVLGEYRPEMVRSIRKAMPNIRLEVFGNDWPDDIGAHPHVTGEAFLEMLGRAKLGIDLTKAPSPMGRRLFEMAACGVPMIARAGPQLDELFDFWHIETWDKQDELCGAICRCLTDDAERDRMAERAYVYVRTQHDISNRVASILEKLG